MSIVGLPLTSNWQSLHRQLLPMEPLLSLKFMELILQLLTELMPRLFFNWMVIAIHRMEFKNTKKLLPQQSMHWQQPTLKFHFFITQFQVQAFEHPTIIDSSFLWMPTVLTPIDSLCCLTRCLYFPLYDPSTPSQSAH